MTARSNADAEFSERPFLVRDAMERGYGRRAFDHDRWQRPFRGVRSRGPAPVTLRDRALHYLPRLRPGERFSHATALALLGCPVRVPKGSAVDVSSPKERGRVVCAGVRGHRHSPGAPEYPCSFPDEERGIPVSPPLVAVLQAASDLPFPELVVALDFLLLRDPRRYDQQLYVLPEELARFADTATGRGVVRFREAAALARVGAESRMETLMRLAGVRAGMPELALQLDATDDRGAWIGRFDAADIASRSLFEYDGEQHHFSRRQRRRDPRKHQQARDAGWRILVFFSEDLAGGPLDAGRRMLAFSGRSGRPIRPALARLLDERSGEDTESAIPLSRAAAGHPDPPHERSKGEFSP